MSQNNQVEFRIAGGLGNQLFMFYAGLYFSQKFKRDVVFDVSDLSRVRSLHPGVNILDLGLLNEFDTKIYHSTGSERFGFSKFRESFKKIQEKVLLSFKMSRIFKPSEIGFIDLTKIPHGTKRIEGYFQTWKFYSETHKKSLLSCESIVEPSQWFLDNAQSIRQRQVAVFHVRRGDYASSENRKSGMLSFSFFEKASHMIPDDFERWIFTDSPSILEKDLQATGARFKVIVPPHDSDPVESLLLMSMASHIVISNSTYSWWAATLSGKNATVYAPSKWFQWRNDPVDLIPNDWIRISSEWEMKQ
jgi:hypothetical protein